MEKLVKIASSLVNPSMEIVGNIIINLHVPYSEKDVTIQINPNIQDYQENVSLPGIDIRQMLVTTSTDETKELKFDFKENNTQKIQVNEDTYEIKLMHIGKEKMEGQDFPFFEFLVKWNAIAKN